MQLIDGRSVYSARDLVGFLACRHLTDLDRLAMAHRLDKPIRDDPELDAIAERGKEHERRYLEELVAAHRVVTDLEVTEDERPTDRLAYYREAAARTREAIEGGADVIFQACFFDESWLGFADFLLRIDDPGAPLGWSYEVADTKLAHSVKASAVLQICVYDELLAAVQGRVPERMHVALGGRERETRTFRTADFAAYYRHAKSQFEAAIGAELATGYDDLTTYPEPTEHCGVCAWDPVCSARRRRDDHLSLVAGIRTRTRADLTERGTTTRRALAALPLPVTARLPHTGGDALERVREQARIQVAGDAIAPRLLHELLELARRPDGSPDTTKGLLRLPTPSHGDLYLDLEGDPFAAEDGIDYLFGILEPGSPGLDGQPRFTAHWSQESDGRITLAAEKRAFKRTIDDIMRAWDADPDMHVYHYAHYERTHLGTLSGRHATRQEEVDRLFRGGRLVDLYQVVVQGLRASVESYSIKRLEPLYGFERSVGLRDAGSSIAEFERWLRKGGESDGDRAALDVIERYNRDDVLSTWHLRDWLEEQRRGLAFRSGEDLPRPPVDEDKPKENLADWLMRVNQVAARLRVGLPEEAMERIQPDQQGRWLLADLLGWHRREEKPDWWRFFNQLRDMTDEERLDAKEPLSMLRLIGRDASDDSGRSFRYGFPEQDYELGRSPVNTATGNEMSVVAVDEERDEVVLRFKNGHDIVHPTSLVSHEYVPSRAQEQRLLDIGEWVADHGIEADGPYRAARDLLMRHPPRIIGHDLGAPLRGGGEEEPENAARRLVPLLDRTTLAIQGPPGAGKTHTGARMILDLVGQGKTVGVTANSHKVIGKLLEDVWRAVEHDPEFAGRSVRIGQKPQEDSGPTFPGAEPMGTERAVATLRSGEVDVVGATAWHWASEKAKGSVDVLFIDEAGQFSLANAIAVSPAADSLVLLGDPQQLDQPLKGTHPAGAGHSALAHLLEGAAVMPEERGLFMRDTWRLHPTICEYTSEVFYEGRLQAHPGNEVQALAGVEPIDGVGIRFVGVDHVQAGDASRSDAEAEVIADLVCDLLDSDAAWTDRDGKRRLIGPSDILVLTPYNAQRKRIGAVLAARGERCATVSVGTVDKFQGQQAPISIYSMASSTPEDAPRGMEFLYSLHRLNVATSRARCVTLVVASPALVSVRARTPRQMELANALCRLVEMAR